MVAAGVARLCNMSRATFARHFQETLGRSANDLLMDIRMTLAANELRKSRMSISAVANAVGYQSEAAFQRAFKQAIRRRGWHCYKLLQPHPGGRQKGPVTECEGGA